MWPTLSCDMVMWVQLILVVLLVELSCFQCQNTIKRLASERNPVLDTCCNLPINASLMECAVQQSSVLALEHLDLGRERGEQTDLGLVSYYRYVYK